MMLGILWNEMVNEYRLARDNIKGKSFVMVEGKTDRALWTEYMAAKDCYLVYADGKDSIVDALRTPVLRGIRGIAGIVDADYWLITEAGELVIDNLLYDDCCPDTEAILLNSPTLKKVLRNNLYNFDIEEIHRFADKLARESHRLANEFGYFRLLNHVEDYGLKCNAIDFAEVVDVNTLVLDREWVARRLTESWMWLTSEELLREVDELRETYPPDNRQLCRGKDVVAIMAYILPTLFSTAFGEDLPHATQAAFEEKALSINLRSAYDSEYFRQTSLFKCIRNWESCNKCYRILKPEI